MRSNNNQLVSIQYLRGVAALMVVMHHARNPVDWLFNPLVGYEAFAWGVDIFFVISGFIMFFVARGENHADFLGRRVIRVVPLYWLATISFLALNTNFHIWWIGMDGFSCVAQSLLFIPHYNLHKPDYIYPYLIAGWTLNYEMLFYLIFFIGLMARRPLLVPTITILFLFFIGLVFNPEWVVLKAYTDPVLLEFLCGVWVAWAYAKWGVGRTTPLVIVFGFITLFAFPFLGAGKLNIVGQIISSALIVSGALFLGGRVPNSKILSLLGDSSYSIYLTHSFISLPMSSVIWRKLPLEGWAQLVGWIVFVLVVSSVIGIAVHWYIEKPAIRLLRSKWENFINNWRINKAAG